MRALGVEEIRPCIVVIAYNREKALERLLASLGAADYPKDQEITLIISIDKSDNPEVLCTAERFEWTKGRKRIEARSEKLGLKRHVLLCGDYSLEYGSAIVLEDDLYVSPLFYRYAVSALGFTDGREGIGGISLYNHLLNVHARAPFYALDDGYDNYYLQFASSWGQAYTKEQWRGFREWLEGAEACEGSGNGLFYNKPQIPANVASWSESSWLKYHIAYLIEKDMYFLYPRISLTTNFMSEGEHSAGENTELQVPLLTGEGKEYRFSGLSESGAVYDAFFENRGLSSLVLKDLRDAPGGAKKADGKAEETLPEDTVLTDLYGYRTSGPAERGKRGEKGNEAGMAGKRRYVLSCRALPYKIVKSYGRKFRPMDLNIVLKQPGEDFFLYDTTEAGPAVKTDPGKQYMYDYRALSLKKLGAILKCKIRNRGGNA